MRSVRVGGRVSSVLATNGSIWTGGFRRSHLDRIDPETLKRSGRSGELGIGLAGLAASGRSMWAVVSRDRRLVRLDARTGRVVGDPVTLPGPSDAITADAKDVWVAVAIPGPTNQVLRIDPATGAIRETLDVTNGVRRLLVHDGALWMISSTPAQLIRVDLGSPNRTRTKFQLGAEVPGDLAVADGSIWVSVTDAALVARVDPETGNVATIAVGRSPTGLAVRAGLVWVANRDDSTVTRVDVRTGRVRDELQVPLNPYEMAATSDAVWVGSLATGRVTRIPLTARGG
jgi:streptogramin lyase